MLQPLTPVTMEATEIVAVADVPALLAADIASTPLPVGKTVDQIQQIVKTRQPNGTFKVDVRFSS